jgi:ferrous iron transport protein A
MTNEFACAACKGCQTCSLDCLQMGCRARVLCVNGDREFRRRLLELGFCNEACIEVIGRAPFGDPIEFRLRGYNLSLRSEQAKNVLVTLQPA